MELLGNHVMTTFALKERETTTQPVCSVHPAALVFPEMSPADLDGLVEDIKQNGLAHPIVRTSEGVVLDGRNRLKACKIAGIDRSLRSTRAATQLASSSAQISSAAN
jgi:hypothetical protein